MGSPAGAAVACLPFFKKQNNFLGESEVHGVGGELRIEAPRVHWDLLDAFRAAAEQAGIKSVADQNTGDNEGCCAFHVDGSAAGAGRRPAAAFLKPVLHRGNLRLETKCLVEGIVLDGRRAVGVRWRQGGQARMARCRGEIVLAAGRAALRQISAAKEGLRHKVRAAQFNCHGSDICLAPRATNANSGKTMSSIPAVWIWLGIIASITLSALFAGLTLAIFSLSQLRLQLEADGGNADAARVLELRKNSNQVLATVIWGNVSTNVLLTLLSDAVLAGLGAFFFSTIVITLFGEFVAGVFLAERFADDGAITAVSDFSGPPRFRGQADGETARLVARRRRHRPSAGT